MSRGRPMGDDHHLRRPGMGCPGGGYGVVPNGPRTLDFKIPWAAISIRQRLTGTSGSGPADATITRLCTYYRMPELLPGRCLTSAMPTRTRHLEERGIFEEVNQEDAGTHRYPGTPLQAIRNPDANPARAGPFGRGQRVRLQDAAQLHRRGVRGVRAAGTHRHGLRR